MTLRCVLLLPLLVVNPVLAADPVADPDPAAASGTSTVHCAQVIDPAAGKAMGPHTFRVANGRIQSVTPGTPSSPATMTFAEGVCVPGLIDLHTHLTNETSPTAYSDVFRLNPADIAYRAQRNARVTLQAGFTTVRDLGDRDLVSLALRDAIQAGLVTGPRIYTAGKSIATTGGHADPTNGRRFDLTGDPGPREGVINSVADARKAVRQRYKDGSDWIKVTATGGVLSVAKNGRNPQFAREELAAVVDTANDYDLPVAAHAHGKEGMRRAILAGVRTIEHGTDMDSELHALMKQHGTWYVPTLLAGDFVTRQAQVPGYYPALVQPKAAAIGPLIVDSFRRAHAAGVRIAFGTDAGVFPHGRNAQEFALMVQGGMTPAEALRSATLHAAAVLGADQELGQLAPGFHADLVVLDGNPLDDIRATERVLAVLKGGEFVTR